MRLTLTLLGVLCVFGYSLAQIRTISGRLTSTEDGSPLPGVSIQIKGTTEGTVTDADGNYSIDVPVGSTLVFSFVGMQTREVLVTGENLTAARPSGTAKKRKQTGELRKTRKPAALPPAFLQKTVEKGPGIAVLSSQSARHTMGEGFDVERIRSIARTGSRYVISMTNNAVRRTGFGMQFTSMAGLETVTQLPLTQQAFSQGRPVSGSLQWRGADQQEIFSWGPHIRELEFDGSNYSFDKNGSLVPIAGGSGMPARKYNPSSFFRSGYTNANELMIAFPVVSDGTVVMGAEHRVRKGIIPNADNQRFNASTSLKHFHLGSDVNLNASVAFTRQHANLMTPGANLAQMIGSIYRTPVTFDNSNGLTPREAIRSHTSYLLEGETHRSHAPGLAANPYGLVNDLPDAERLQRIIGTINLQQTAVHAFQMNLNASVDHQSGQVEFGIAPGYPGADGGKRTLRDDRSLVANTILSPSFTHYGWNGLFKLTASWQTQYSARNLHRTDGTSFTRETFANIDKASSVTIIRKALSRLVHELTLSAQYEHSNWLMVKAGSQNYFSNSVSQDRYSNFFPSTSISADFANLLDLWPVRKLKLYLTQSKTIREAPLLYNSWSYASTRIDVEDYTSFYQSSELFFHAGLSPETEDKYEAGLNLDVSSRFSVDAALYRNRTKDFIAPLWMSSKFHLQNVGSIRNTGILLTANYHGAFRNGNWRTSLTWSTSNSVAGELNGGLAQVPLTGFQSVQSVLALGKPVGAIFGTSYLRNDSGKQVIGPDGFPLEDTTLKMIGNPIPDWTLGWSSHVSVQQWRLGVVVDVRKGGDQWNGTNAMLDYLGRSSTTARLRSTTDYVFKGVDANNRPNTVQVDFANPSDDITENRWVRYGADGIGEDYIEDTSWVRLNELSLGWASRIRASQARIKEIRVTLTGRNLLMLTPYSGSDPSSTLFGYTGAGGLDFFNSPSVRSYTAQVTLKI